MTFHPIPILLRLVVVVVVIITFATTLAKVAADDDSTKLIINNQSRKIVTINWIDTRTNEPLYLAESNSGRTFTVNTFLGHEFQLVEQPPSSSTTDDGNDGSCGEEEGTCKSTNFVVSKVGEEVLFLTRQFRLVSEEDYNGEMNIPAENVANYCKERAHNKLKELSTAVDKGNPEQIIMEEFRDCMTMGIAPKLREVKEEYDFEHEIRTGLAHQLENFTCNNPELGTSPDVDYHEWVSERDHVTRPVHIKLDRPASRIHVIENFASVEECDAMEAKAKPKLHHASVADGKGGVQFSEARKALQAGITPDFKLEWRGDLVARLSRRVYDYTSYVLGLNLTEHGQEPLMSIQYFGRGLTDGEPDRYRPHCDGKCDGEGHPYGTRCATMVIYCTIPEKGGHTNFQNAGVHVKPELGSAIFFSYIDPATNLTDNGLTQHSGCPVYEGEKKIITQWVRYGVDNNDRKHNHFNTLGILNRESGDN